MSDDENQTGSTPPSLEVERAWALPTINSNRFILTVWPDKMRISFGEQVVADQQSNMHCAVALSMDDALALSRMIQEYARSVNANISSEDDNGE